MEYSKLPAEFSQSSPEIHAPEEFPATTVGKKKKKSKRSAGIMAILAGFLTVSLYFDVMLPFDMGAAEPDEPSLQQPTDPSSPSVPQTPSTDPTTGATDATDATTETLPDPEPEVPSVQELCSSFSGAINLLRWWAPSQDVAPGESFGAENILDYTAFQTCSDEYGEKLVTEGDYSYYATYAIPADVFEAAAADRFATVDADQLRSVTGYFYDQETQTSDSNFQFYQPDRKVYLFPYQGGWGDPSHYEVIGYTENDDGTYTVYSTFLDIYGDEAPEGEEGVDYLVMDGTYWIIESHLQTVVALSGDTVQFHSWQRIDAIPDIPMIQPQ